MTQKYLFLFSNWHEINKNESMIPVGGGWNLRVANAVCALHGRSAILSQINLTPSSWWNAHMRRYFSVACCIDSSTLDILVVNRITNIIPNLHYPPKHPDGFDFECVVHILKCMVEITFMSICFAIAFSLNRSLFVRVMVCSRQATIQYFNQFWPNPIKLSFVSYISA